MMRAIQLAVACVAMLVVTTRQVNAGIINFEDIYSSLGDGSDPATFYQGTLGVTFGGDYFGVAGGVSNGDVGSWDLDGTNGPAFLGNNFSGGLTTTFAFASPVDLVSFDVGENFGASNVFTASALLDGIIVATDSVTISDDNNGTGTWHTFNFSVPLDEISITGSNNSGYGLDNIQFTQAVPEPSSLAMFGIGACVVGIGAARRRRREKQQQATA